MRCLCRPSWACFFLFCFSLASLNDFSPSGSNAGFYPPGFHRCPRICPQLAHTASTGRGTHLAGIVPLLGFQSRTQGRTRVFLVSAPTLPTFPLRGKAVLFSKLGCPGFLDSSTTASHGSNGAGLRPLWCRFLTRPSKPHTGPHRGVFGFSVFSFHSFLAAVPLTAAPGDNSPLHEWAKSCRAASRFSRFRPTSTRLSAGFR